MRSFIKGRLPRAGCKIIYQANGHRAKSVHALMRNAHNMRHFHTTAIQYLQNIQSENTRMFYIKVREYVMGIQTCDCHMTLMRVRKNELRIQKEVFHTDLKYVGTVCASLLEQSATFGTFRISIFFVHKNDYFFLSLSSSFLYLFTSKKWGC